ncbi:MAG: class I mannose-6-phosphate isomerase [Clostridia bacterium]|nr:class I mannose-6-phosphate isomerase [Clostridia bacterium]
MEKNLYPLKLTSIQKNVIWGGNKLCSNWGKTAADPDTVGEAWLLSVREKEVCTIENGEFAGKNMWDFIKANGGAVISENNGGESFPLLIKLIDANDKLSVQVHPDDEYAKNIENDLGKTEMWYIVEADEDSSIVYGLDKGVTKEDFRRYVEQGETEKALKFQPVKAGEVYFIPSGMVHAIGKGLLIAEVQQNSDLTYRVYDYNRRQNDGSLRKLHVEKAFDVTAEFTDEKVRKICFEKGENGGAIVNCRYFKVEKITENAVRFANEKSFHSIICLKGEGVIEYNGQDYSVKKGDSWFIPAGAGVYTLKLNRAEFLISSVN